MEKAKELIELYPHTAHGRILWAKTLTEAKGRFNRTWIANPGGLWIVATLYEEIHPENQGLLALAIGLALAKTVRTLNLNEVYLKWVNDLHYQGRKLAGVLMEKWKEWYLIGIGLNVNNPLPAELPAINLKTLLNSEVSLSYLLELLISNLNYYYYLLWEYERNSDEEAPNPILKEFRLYSDTLGRCVYYSYNLDLEEEGIIGIAKELTPKGGLLLQGEEGEIEVYSGEILYLL